jgi:hypothetical protein
VAQKKKAKQNKKQEAEAEALRSEEEKMMGALVKKELEERMKTLDLAKNYTSDGTISEDGFYEGKWWRKMKEADVEKAMECEAVINFSSLKNKLDEEKLVFVHFRYAERMFAVARHSNGHWRILGMPDVRAQMDRSIPKFFAEDEEGDDFSRMIDPIIKELKEAELAKGVEIEIK